MKNLKIKQRLLLVIISVIMFLMSGCESSSISPFAESKDVLLIVDNEGVSELLDGDRSFYLYVGRPTCPFSVDFEPILEHVLTNRQVSIYYFEIDLAREKGSERTSELMNLLGIVGVPSIVYIEDGEVINIRECMLSYGELSIFFESHQ